MPISEAAHNRQLRLASSSVTDIHLCPHYCAAFRSVVSVVRVKRRSDAQSKKRDNVQPLESAAHNTLSSLPLHWHLAWLDECPDAVGQVQSAGTPKMRSSVMSDTKRSSQRGKCSALNGATHIFLDASLLFDTYIQHGSIHSRALPITRPPESSDPRSLYCTKAQSRRSLAKIQPRTTWSLAQSLLATCHGLNVTLSTQVTAPVVVSKETAVQTGQANGRLFEHKAPPHIPNLPPHIPNPPTHFPHFNHQDR
jgi:hypothetical protein